MLPGIRKINRRDLKRGWKISSAPFREFSRSFATADLRCALPAVWLSSGFLPIDKRYTNLKKNIEKRKIDLIWKSFYKFLAFFDINAIIIDMEA